MADKALRVTEQYSGVYSKKGNVTWVVGNLYFIVQSIGGLTYTELQHKVYFVESNQIICFEQHIKNRLSQN